MLWDMLVTFIDLLVYSHFQSNQPKPSSILSIFFFLFNLFEQLSIESNQNGELQNILTFSGSFDVLCAIVLVWRHDVLVLTAKFQAVPCF